MKNLAWVGAAQSAKLVVTAVSLVGLSRLIAPSAYGAFAIVLAVLGLADLFRDLGLPLAAIQSKRLSRVERDNLFWANLLLGVGASVVVVAAAFPISAFYGNPELRVLLQVVASTFAVNGAAAQYRVSLVRSNRYRALSAVDIAAAAVGLAAALALAVLGAGAFALALQSVLIAVVSLIGYAAIARWRPRAPRRIRTSRKFLRFGGELLVVQVVSYFATNADTLAIGKVFGIQVLGYYSKAYSLYQQPVSQLFAPFTNLIVSRLGRLQHDPSDYLQLLLRIHKMAGFIGFTTFAFAFGSAPALIEVLLGPNWRPSIPLFQALCVGGAFQMLGFVYYWLFLSLARTRVYLLCAVVSQPIALALILVSIPFGVQATAWATTGGNFIEFLIPAVWGASRCIAESRQLFVNAIGPVLTAVAVGASGALVSVRWPGHDPVTELVVALVAAVVLIGAGGFLDRDARRYIREVFVMRGRRV